MNHRPLAKKHTQKKHKLFFLWLAKKINSLFYLRIISLDIFIPDSIGKEDTAIFKNKNTHKKNTLFFLSLEKKINSLFYLSRISLYNIYFRFDWKRRYEVHGFVAVIINSKK